MIFFFFNHFPSDLHLCISVGLCSTYYLLEYFLGLEILRYVFGFLLEIHPKGANVQIKALLKNKQFTDLMNEFLYLSFS